MNATAKLKRLIITEMAIRADLLKSRSFWTDVAQEITTDYYLISETEVQDVFFNSIQPALEEFNYGITDEKFLSAIKNLQRISSMDSPKLEHEDDYEMDDTEAPPCYSLFDDSNVELQFAECHSQYLQVMENTQFDPLDSVLIANQGEQTKIQEVSIDNESAKEQFALVESLCNEQTSDPPEASNTLPEALKLSAIPNGSIPASQKSIDEDIFYISSNDSDREESAFDEQQAAECNNPIKQEAEQTPPRNQSFKFKPFVVSDSDDVLPQSTMKSSQENTRNVEESPRFKNFLEQANQRLKAIEEKQRIEEISKLQNNQHCEDSNNSSDRPNTATASVKAAWGDLVFADSDDDDEPPPPPKANKPWCDLEFADSD